MQVVNLATASVTTSATEILSVVAARIAASEGMDCVIINPSVDIVLVDAAGAAVASPIPGAVAGTVANSPLVCPAGSATVVLHRAGAVFGISTSGTATVKRAVGCAP